MRTELRPRRDRGRTASMPLLGIASLLIALARPLSAQASARELRTVVDSLYAALTRGDSAVLRSRLAKDLVWVVGATGDELSYSQLLALASRAQNPPPRFDVDSVEVHGMEDLALVSFRRTDHRSVASVDFPARWRVLDVFGKRGGRWQLLHHMQTWLVVPVKPVSIDSVSLQAFVGRYAAAPGIVDDVHWENGHLGATLTGFPPGARLVPVSGSVFSPEGVGALIAFERDSTGRVIGYVQGYPDGRVDRRPKLP